MVNKNKAFTLIEITLVVGLLSVIALIATPYLLGTEEKMMLQKERDKIVNDLENSQQRSIGAEKGQEHSVNFQTESYILNPDNKTVLLNSRVEISQKSADSVSFAKLTGLPNNSLSLTLSSQKFQCQIAINEQGLISFTEIEEL